MGDAHIAQGDSEFDGTGIETSITGRFKVTLHKKGRLPKTLRVRRSGICLPSEQTKARLLGWLAHIRTPLVLGACSTVKVQHLQECCTITETTYVALQCWGWQ
jgi:acetamidase/formamidase